MTSLQGSLSSSWIISLRRMRGHIPARSQMEEERHRAHWFWLEMVRGAKVYCCPTISLSNVIPTQSDPTKPAVSDYIQQKKNSTLWTVFLFSFFLFFKWMCAERTYHNLLFFSVLIRGYAVKPKPGETQTCSRECIEWAFLYDSRLSICCIRDPIMEMY